MILVSNPNSRSVAAASSAILPISGLRSGSIETDGTSTNSRRSSTKRCLVLVA
jgi:hypothetical protein